MTDHDFEVQREETYWVWNDLSKNRDLPQSAVLELQFVPIEGRAVWDAFEKRLDATGYRFARYEDGSTLEASIGPIDLSFEAIWKHEALTTQIAVECGFSPDGWGFVSSD